MRWVFRLMAASAMVIACQSLAQAEAAGQHGSLGVMLAPVTPEEMNKAGLEQVQGGIAAQILPGGAAERAGIRAGDVIVSIDGQAVSSPQDIVQRLSAHLPGSQVAVTVLRRNGQSVDMHNLSATLGIATEMAPPPASPDRPVAKPPAAPSIAAGPGKPRSYLGVEFAPITPEAKARAGLVEVNGAIAAQVAPGSPAEQAGVRAGDFIVGIDDHGVASIEDILQRASNYAPGQSMTINLLRPNGRSVDLQKVPVILGRAPAAVAAAVQPGPRPAGPGAAGPTGRTNFADELADFGVAPKPSLESNVGSPTPTSIPGGQVITTGGLSGALKRGIPLLLIDALNDGGRGHPTLPNARKLPFAGEAGSFNDQTQQALAAVLGQFTGNRRDVPLVFFCLSAQCWESYNASLRAINLGFTNVLWYRGGLMAWQAAGLPVQ